MQKTIILFILIFISQFSGAQIVINEVDSDTVGTDTMEFIELKSDTANFSLNGYVVVLFNGSTNGADSSYYAIDLDGYTTDVNGLLLIGSNDVSPVPQLIIPIVIQNGQDAVAIYQANDYDFIDGTLATTTNLIDALVYDTSDPDDTVLMNLLGVSVQINENLHGNKTTESVQRNNDGTYFVGSPTPRQLNDGSGIILNGVSFNTSQSQYNEGDTFIVNFATEQNVINTPLNINLTLDNGSFNTADFSGNLMLTIPVGQNTISTTITVIDDALDEGDEVLNIHVDNLPVAYLSLNNDLKVRVIDNDYQIANFGTPLNPTYNNVQSTQPNDYYNSLNGLTDVNLRQAIQNIVAEQYVVREHTYADIIEILKAADQNPLNSNQVWLAYTEQGRAKLDYQNSSIGTGKWNREHTFPRSRGGFNSIEADDIADGINLYWETHADSLRHGNSDAHALRAVDSPQNSSRGNQHYGQYNGPSGNLGSFKGDVARSVFYMAVRYNGLEIVNGFPNTLGQLGDLATLLDWHRNDPPDDFEMNRNNIIYDWQINRNPFIDQPDMIEYIWGNQIGNTWLQTLNIDNVYLIHINIYPNPTHNNINVLGIIKPTLIEIISLDSKVLYKSLINKDSKLKIDLPKGVYFIKMTSDNKIMNKKLVIN